MEHKFMSKAWVREMEGKQITLELELDIPLEVLILGVTPGDKILHVGACDSDVNLIEGFEERGVDVFYLGVDVKEEIKELGEKYKNVDHYSFIQQPIQQLIDDELADQYEIQSYKAGIAVLLLFRNTMLHVGKTVNFFPPLHYNALWRLESRL